MRLIDADALKKRWTIASPEPYNTDVAEVLNSIDEQPTAIGQCKECKSADFIYEDDVDMCYCLEHGRPMCSDDFCIYFCEEVE